MGLDFKLNSEALLRLEVSENKVRDQKKEFTILCVDDEEANLTALRSLLEDKYNVATVGSGSEATEYLMRNTVEVVITDQRMPHLLGTEFLTELSERNLNNNSRIILTGFSDVGALMDCINKGLVDRYMLKPWSPDEMLLMISQAIEKITLKRTLNKLLPEKIIKRLYPEGMNNINVGFGKEFKCVILFADLWQFTSLAETMSPIDSFRLISSYFNHIAPIVNQHRGYIDKYLGDGILAIFDYENSFCDDAINCALQIEKETRNYNSIHRSNQAQYGRAVGGTRIPLRVGLGLYLGEVVLGTVGFNERIDFTVLGDSVNTASRIQAITNLLQAPILISNDLANTLDSAIPKRYLGKTPIRGKSSEVAIWEVLRDTLEDRNKLIYADELTAILANYKAENLSQSLQKLDSLIERFPQDIALVKVKAHLK